MKKVIAKAVRHMKHAVSPLAEAEGVEIPLQTTTAEEEAFDILSRLANSMPAHMGTAHGIALIQDAQGWLKKHAETE
jgi:hypothetical protein